MALSFLKQENIKKKKSQQEFIKFTTILSQEDSCSSVISGSMQAMT